MSVDFNGSPLSRTLYHPILWALAVSGRLPALGGSLSPLPLPACHYIWGAVPRPFPLYPCPPQSACRSPSAGLWPFLCTSPPADEHRQNLFLLPSPDLEETSLRKRTGPLPDEKQSAAELDAVLQHHHSIQEKLAEEMLHLARNLKNNTLVAQNVIKQDNQTLSHSLKLADHNFEKLKDESDRLEQHAKKSVNWLLWLMLIVVCFIFISMILFIRIFPKLR
ncbi:vesicle transport protein USE1 isoform X3 [Zootoca vivipara]|uniref:vesicle transport protein USE1 isoform X3 n=1 Tax=Zootoca vivipara TaxID=8524 RepID=UPI00293BDAAA|nr:vesicle transport protein USE1 isoform X3 [Zootoca vivipara]